VPNLALSVVVCTHNRPHDLRRCLDAFAALEDPVEVIVVDSASDPDCWGLVREMAQTIRRLRYVREDQPGLSLARNRGVAEANGRFVAFIDDDAAPRSDWARRVVEAFDADQAIGCVGGACIARFEVEEQRPSWLSDRLLQFAGITRFGERPREALSSAEWPFGANVAFRSTALRSSAPFAEELGRDGETLLSGEEYALIEALRAVGWKIWLEPRAVVEHTVHIERCESRYYWRRLWWAGVSRARSGHAASSIALRLLIACPIRLFLYVLTRDRVHLYRTAETAGFFAERMRLLGRAT
jgi:glycosyltransferase involved in cell wall biosynthesis